jgi:hypothetical protein
MLSVSCLPLKQARMAAVARTVADVADAAAKQSDPTVVRAGTPAYLMLIDGLVEAFPENEDLLLAGCKAYIFFASSFLEDSHPEEASALYAKARDYGFRALSRKRDFRGARSGSLAGFTSFLESYGREDVPALFWTARAWMGWIKANLEDMEALADLPLVEATMRRILELDDSFYYGSPHLFMATYLAARPAVLGGNLSKAREHFETALAQAQGKLLMARVLFARYYAVGVGDRALFEDTLQEVLKMPADRVPELTLSNVLAKRKARELLEKADEYFADYP